jgi:formylglycine-generating enzyme required for sulfatase activity
MGLFCAGSTRLGAQIKITPKPAPARTVTPASATAVARANVLVYWDGTQTVNIHIGDRSITLASQGEATMSLQVGKGLKVRIEKPNKTIYAEEFLLVDKSGGNLALSIVKGSDNEEAVGLTYESTKDRIAREAQEAADAAEEERKAAAEAAAALVELKRRMELAYSDGVAEATNNPAKAAQVKTMFTANVSDIAGGMFKMGCTSEQGSDCYDDEKPAHQVTVSSFRMGKYEVTQAEWEAVMGTNPSYFKNCPTCPVEQVSWEDVQLFLQKLNGLTGGRYRLPTEAEWEYAARGGNRSNGTKYSGSNDISGVGWYDGNSGNKTHPVGEKAANELGLYDMSGNVYEWCSDWFGDYSSSAQTNPQGPSSGTCRVLRGGGWDYDARLSRVSCRGSGTPGARYGYYGFRLVFPVQ